jgi:hypothetical protein
MFMDPTKTVQKKLTNCPTNLAGERVAIVNAACRTGEVALNSTRRDHPKGEPSRGNREGGGRDHHHIVAKRKLEKARNKLGDRKTEDIMANGGGMTDPSTRSVGQKVPFWKRAWGAATVVKKRPVYGARKSRGRRENIGEAIGGGNMRIPWSGCTGS